MAARRTSTTTSPASPTGASAGNYSGEIGGATPAALAPAGCCVRCRCSGACCASRAPSADARARLAALSTGTRDARRATRRRPATRRLVHALLRVRRAGQPASRRRWPAAAAHQGPSADRIRPARRQPTSPAVGNRSGHHAAAPTRLPLQAFRLAAAGSRTPHARRARHARLVSAGARVVSRQPDACSSVCIMRCRPPIATRGSHPIPSAANATAASGRTAAKAPTKRPAS